MRDYIFKFCIKVYKHAVKIFACAQSFKISKMYESQIISQLQVKIWK